MPEYRYRVDVLAQLWRHGVHPTPHTPPELVMAHLGIDKGTLDAMPKDEVVVMPK